MSFVSANNYKRLESDSAAIQAAVDEATKIHGIAVIPAEGVYQNIFTNSNFGTPAAYTKEGTQKDIHIYGVGNVLLDGGNPVTELTEATSRENGLPHVTQNSMFNCINFESIKIENINIKNQCYWAIVFHYCTHGKVSGINFNVSNVYHNQDGIDLRTGCSDFVVEKSGKLC